jgi:hypothetical protein
MLVQNRLITVWRRNAGVSGADPWVAEAADESTVRRYRVEDGGDEAMLWIEGHRVDAGRLAAIEGEIFTFSLARDVGGSSEFPGRWLYIVHTDIPSDVVDDYNAWYDEEHLPRLVGVPGVERARRYVADESLSPRYLTAYDLSIRGAFESPQGLKARKTPWTERMRSLFQNTRRKMCILQP